MVALSVDWWVESRVVQMVDLLVVWLVALLLFGGDVDVDGWVDARIDMLY